MANIYVGSDTFNDKIDRSAFGTSDGLSGLGGNDIYYVGLKSATSTDQVFFDRVNENETTGVDTLIDQSTSSSDTYGWGRNMGIDNLSDSSGNDRLDVLTGVTASQLWLRHVGNGLELSVIGTNDKFIINNWYSSAANQVESIKLADGKTLTANKVENLVQAMANGLTPPPLGQTTLPANYQTTLNPVIAANWV